jgi:hypothetical protein
VPMLSPGSTSLEYADKSNFPYLLRTVGSDKLQFEALVQLARHFGWRRLGGLVQQSASGLSQLTELEASVSKGGLVLWGQILVKTGRCNSLPLHERRCLCGSRCRFFVSSACKFSAKRISTGVDVLPHVLVQSRGSFLRLGPAGPVGMSRHHGRPCH